MTVDKQNGAEYRCDRSWCGGIVDGCSGIELQHMCCYLVTIIISSLQTQYHYTHMSALVEYVWGGRGRGREGWLSLNNTNMSVLIYVRGEIMIITT